MADMPLPHMCQVWGCLKQQSPNRALTGGPRCPWVPGAALTTQAGTRPCARAEPTALGGKKGSSAVGRSQNGSLGCTAHLHLAPILLLAILRDGFDVPIDKFLWGRERACGEERQWDGV